MKYSLSLHQNYPFAQCPAIVQLEGEKIVCNDVHLPQHIEKTFNPHNVQMYVIGNEYGADVLR